MSSPPINELPPFRPRRFLPAKLDAGDWSQIVPHFDRLEARAAQCSIVADLEAWLLDWSELHAALAEEAARRYIAMTCHTDDTEARQAYLHFVEQVHPKIQVRQFRLAQDFLNHPLRRLLPARRYQIFDRDTAVTAELFREENVPLETEEAKLVQKYVEVTGAMTVPFRGEERTIQQMSKFLEEPDRATRQEAWELAANRALADADKLEGVFDSLLQCRERIAVNAGCENYRDHAWRRLRRFDYTPEQCIEFHAAIESEILPVVCELQEQRRKKLGVSTLRPWDTEVDPSGEPPLRPFMTTPELVSRTQRIFDRTDTELANSFRQLQDLPLLDLENRPDKAPGGYQLPLLESGLPFVFQNTVGVHMDVLTMLHEAGHAFHTLAARADPLLAYRTAPVEFCEVASLSMELIGSETLGEFYPPAEVRRARRTHFEIILTSFPWIASLDAFQHWIYTHPGHTQTERANAWVAQMKRFGGLIDWSDYEPIRDNLWHDVLHLYHAPFYFIEYGIAWLGALQVWSHWKQDPQGTLADYQRTLALGGSRPLPELFAAAGCNFEFDATSMRPLVRLIRSEIEQLQA